VRQKTRLTGHRNMSFNQNLFKSSWQWTTSRWGG